MSATIGIREQIDLIQTQVRDAKTTIIVASNNVKSLSVTSKKTRDGRLAGTVMSDLRNALARLKDATNSLSAIDANLQSQEMKR